MLMSRRAHRTVAFLCLAAFTLAVFLPGVAAADYAVVPAVEWVLLPELAPLDVVSAAPVSTEQLRALRAALPPRAPPSSSLS
jgi:hypothetical protein